MASWCGGGGGGCGCDDDDGTKFAFCDLYSVHFFAAYHNVLQLVFVFAYYYCTAMYEILYEINFY